MNSHQVPVARSGFLLLVMILAGSAAALNPWRIEAAPTVQISALEENLPLLFIENRGQIDPSVAYYLQGRTNTLYFSPGGVTLALGNPHADSAPAAATGGLEKVALRSSPQRWAVKLDFVGANPNAIPRGEAPRDTVVSYFKGGREMWQRGLKTYAHLRYRELWPGIDLLYSGTVGRLKYHFEIKPGADPKRIRLAYRGAAGVTLTDTGQLDVTTPVGGFQDDRPVAWQEIDGRRVRVDAQYDLHAEQDDGSYGYGFRLGRYDATRALLLDPALIVYAGYIGGADSDEGSGIAVDGAGNTYVTGWTQSTSTSFPEVIGPELTFNGFKDAFVAKVAADGTELVYAGYIGGGGRDEGRGIAVDALGNAYITGDTISSETTFPVRNGPDLTYNGGRDDAFVAKIAADGTDLLYAGYIGGGRLDRGRGIAVDVAGNAYVTGVTRSDESTFPTMGGPDLAYNGGKDAFVAKVAADGKEIAYAGYIGGDGDDAGYDIAVDGAGNAYVTGETRSDEATFPASGGPDLVSNGFYDAFVAKVAADGTDFIFAGYLGGSANDSGYGIAVDGAGNAYVTGVTSSDEATFPVAIGPDLTFNGGTDAFVTKVAADGTDLVYSGFIGGSGDDSGHGVAANGAGNAFVTGDTDSGDATFPVAGGPDLTANGSSDASLAKVAADGTDLLYAGYIGGVGFDRGRDIALDVAGSAYVTGWTESLFSFPLQGGPDLTYNGDRDAFVAKAADSAALSGVVVPYLTANGFDDYLAIPTGTLLSLRVGLRVGPPLVGVPADWWVAAVSERGVWYSYRYAEEKWIYAGVSPQDLKVSDQAVLEHMPDNEILRTTELPPGRYVAYFGVDTVMNGVVDLSEAYYDSAIVDIE